MIEVPIVVNDEEVSVATFIDQVDVQVDVGPRGTRGSLIFTGIGDPGSKVQPPSETADPVFQGVSEVRVNDLYIDLATTGYAWLYKYQPPPLDWTLVGRMNPPLYVGRHLANFTNGVATLSIPLEDIIGATSTTLDGNHFIVNVNALVPGGDTTTYLVNPTSVTVTGSNLDVVFHLRALSTTAVSMPASVNNLDLRVSVGVSA